MHQYIDKILLAADKAYHGGEARISEGLQKGERGDTLAEFVAIELREVLDGSDVGEMKEIALNAITRARDELSSVCDAIEALPDAAENG